MAKFTQHQLRINSDSNWIDVNPNISGNAQPERYSDEISVLYSSVNNLLSCPIGARGRIFQPEYGSSLYWFLQEPIDEVTAAAIKVSVYNTFKRWEPRIQIGLGDITVTPDTKLPGYYIKIKGKFVLNDVEVSAEYTAIQ